MALTPRQQQLLANFKHNGYDTPEKVRAWCEMKLTQRGRGQNKAPNRRIHSLQYYRDILTWLP